MKAVRHVDNHGSTVRELVEGLRRHEHATERLYRQIDAHEACDFRRPRPCTVDDYVSGNRALAAFNRADPCALAVDSRYLCSFPDLRAVFACPGHQPHHGAVRIYKTIAGAEAATNDVVATQLRRHTANVIAGDQLHVLEAKRNLALVVSAQIFEMLLVGRAEKIALRPISARISEPFLKTRVEGNGVEGHLDVDRGCELGPDPAHALPGCAYASGALALEYETVSA